MLCTLGYVYIYIYTRSFVVTCFIAFGIINHTHVSRNGFGELCFFNFFHGYDTSRTGSKRGNYLQRNILLGTRLTVKQNNR